MLWRWRILLSAGPGMGLLSARPRSGRLLLSTRSADTARPWRHVFLRRQFAIAILIQLFQGSSGVGHLRLINDAVSIDIESINDG